MNHSAWQDITLVLVGCLPFLAGMGALLAKLVTSSSTKAQAAYTEVGGFGGLGVGGQGVVWWLAA